MLMNSGTVEPSVPDAYRQAWNVIVTGSPSDSFSVPIDADVPLGSLHSFLGSAAKLGPGSAEQIVTIACKGSRCSRTDFYLALGLLHQMQQGDELDVQAAQQRLNAGTLGVPTLHLAEHASGARNSHTFPPAAAPSGFGRSDPRPAGPMREMSDPWNPSGNSSLNGNDHRSTPNHVYDGMPNQHDAGMSYDSAFRGGFAANGSSGVDRTRSTLADPRRSQQLYTHAEDAPNAFLAADQARRNPTARQERPFSYMSDTAETNAADATEDPSAELPEDVVAVRLRSELEGFIIKHNVYVVTSSLRKSSVTRRYSDWLWLAECLVKRYPFRCLPVLPPKRIAMPIAGRHLSADDLFIERRRRGLERYLRMLTCHPMLRSDKLVEVFFTEPRSIAEWKSSAPALFLDEEGLVKIAQLFAALGDRDVGQTVEARERQLAAHRRGHDDDGGHLAGAFGSDRVTCECRIAVDARRAQGAAGLDRVVPRPGGTHRPADGGPDRHAQEAHRGDAEEAHHARHRSWARGEHRAGAGDAVGAGQAGHAVDPKVPQPAHPRQEDHLGGTDLVPPPLQGRRTRPAQVCARRDLLPRQPHAHLGDGRDEDEDDPLNVRRPLHFLHVGVLLGMPQPFLCT
ncbi:hypothetical protein L1887_56886 [Cichorium endivia]|nr:hypothetical protein L1887_56886 [Cichorium endivia]